jgi:hypothetical protein
VAALFPPQHREWALPTMLAEYAQLAREAAEANENYEQYLLRLPSSASWWRPQRACNREVVARGAFVVYTNHADNRSRD